MSKKIASKLLSQVCFAMEADGLFKDYATKKLRRWWRKRKKNTNT